MQNKQDTYKHCILTERKNQSQTTAISNTHSQNKQKLKLKWQAVITGDILCQ